MPVISFANPKGGTSKTTSCLLLGTALAADGASVTLLDADRNQPLSRWAKGRDLGRIRVLPALDEETFVSMLDREAAGRDAVLVDLEGTASRILSRSVMRSDLVLIPMQPSSLDAHQAGRAVSLIRQEEEILRRTIPSRILLTRTSPAIPTRAERAIVKEMEAAGIMALKTHLHERAAFKAMFAFATDLDDLDASLVNGIEQAKANAITYRDEVAVLLRQIIQQRAAA